MRPFCFCVSPRARTRRHTRTRGYVLLRLAHGLVALASPLSLLITVMIFISRRFIEFCKFTALSTHIAEHERKQIAVPIEVDTSGSIGDASEAIGDTLTSEISGVGGGATARAAAASSEATASGVAQLQQQHDALVRRLDEQQQMLARVGCRDACFATAAVVTHDDS